MNTDDIKLKTAQDFVRDFTCSHFSTPRFTSGCLTCLTALIRTVQADAIECASNWVGEREGVDFDLPDLLKY